MANVLFLLSVDVSHKTLVKCFPLLLDNLCHESYCTPHKAQAKKNKHAIFVIQLEHHSCVLSHMRSLHLSISGTLVCIGEQFFNICKKAKLSGKFNKLIYFI